MTDFDKKLDEIINRSVDGVDDYKEYIKIKLKSLIRELIEKAKPQTRETEKVVGQLVGTNTIGITHGMVSEIFGKDVDTYNQALSDYKQALLKELDDKTK